MDSKIKILIGVLAGICGIIILCLISSNCSSYSCCYCFDLICIETGFREVSKDMQKITEIYSIQVALEMYYQMHGQYPGISGKNSWKEIKETLIKEKLLTPKQMFYEPEYWVSENKKEYVLKMLLNTHLEELNKDVDGYPLGPDKVWCGKNGEKEREYCIYNTKIKELKLSDFPEAFEDSTLIVVGDNTSDIEMQAVNEIADYLEKETGNRPLIKKYSEITEEDKRNYNLIVVGTPKTNPFLEEVYQMTDATRVTEEFPGEGKGVLEILRSPWDGSKAMLLVEGWGDIRPTSEALLDKGVIINKSKWIIKFEKYEIGNLLVYFHQRRIENAIVEGDYIRYKFNKTTGELLNKTIHWRTDLPEHLPKIISKEEAESKVKGEIISAKLYFISPDSKVFPVKSTPENPCWIIWSSTEDEGLIITIIDAVNGEILGYGIPPPKIGGDVD